MKTTTQHFIKNYNALQINKKNNTHKTLHDVSDNKNVNTRGTIKHD